MPVAVFRRPMPGVQAARRSCKDMPGYRPFAPLQGDVKSLKKNLCLYLLPENDIRQLTVILLGNVFVARSISLGTLDTQMKLSRTTKI